MLRIHSLQSGLLATLHGNLTSLSLRNPQGTIGAQTQSIHTSFRHKTIFHADSQGTSTFARLSTSAFSQTSTTFGRPPGPAAVASRTEPHNLLLSNENKHAQIRGRGGKVGKSESAPHSASHRSRFDMEISAQITPQSNEHDSGGEPTAPQRPPNTSHSQITSTPRIPSAAVDSARPAVHCTQMRTRPPPCNPIVNLFTLTTAAASFPRLFREKGNSTHTDTTQFLG